MTNGNGPQERIEPGQPAEPAQPDEPKPSDKIGSVRKTLPPQGSITVICPNCRQPAFQVGREIICTQCDVIFAITAKKGAQVKQIGPIEELDQRVTKIEGTVGIKADDADTLAEKEAAARKEGAAEVAAEVAAEIESETPAAPAGPARPASQDGVHTDEDEILGPRGDEN